MILKQIPSKLVDEQPMQKISDDSFTKVQGIDWRPDVDSFRLTVEKKVMNETLTKRTLISDIVRIYDDLGWCSPTVIKPKILLQCLWKAKLEWDEIVPIDI